ncbi:MAG: hypothetical protein M3063_00890 [Actinomycetota bacterium]|nr:hypothetical protein [Actinomycetota bacterium]
MFIELVVTRPASIIVIVILAIGMIGALTAMAQRSRGHKLEHWELENEENGRFLPSPDPHNPRCPRCHGRGKVAGVAGRECPVCLGEKYVRFGPGT